MCIGIYWQLWGQVEFGDKYIVISPFWKGYPHLEVPNVKAIAYFMLRCINEEAP